MQWVFFYLTPIIYLIVFPTWDVVHCSLLVAINNEGMTSVTNDCDTTEKCEEMNEIPNRAKCQLYISIRELLICSFLSDNSVIQFLIL